MWTPLSVRIAQRAGVRQAHVRGLLLQRPGGDGSGALRVPGLQQALSICIAPVRAVLALHAAWPVACGYQHPGHATRLELALAMHLLCSRLGTSNRTFRVKTTRPGYLQGAAGRHRSSAPAARRRERRPPPLPPRWQRPARRLLAPRPAAAHAARAFASLGCALSATANSALMWA
jgi:hypothetical protein